MFFKKKVAQNELLLTVKKQCHTDYVFWNIEQDLGASCETIVRAGPLASMAYAYARRTAAAALHIQGLFDKPAYDHAAAMFKSYQINTDGSVVFQEQAAAISSAFLLSYHHMLTPFFERGLLMIVRDYEIPTAERRSDADLFREVLETIYAAQGGA